MKEKIQKPKTDKSKYQNLTPQKKYLVIEICREYLRVINDSEEPILYPKYLFDIVDYRLPSGWSFEEFDDGEYFMGPVELNKKGFYENFFDHVPEAKTQFKKIFNSMLQDPVFKGSSR